ncbi:IS200/IS605 family transposase [Conexibacter sp. S30A1]|uniref:IS200/IS605 family transposase n=1 Tax=Conexibacter sp. S30A1 TaxID=2937800 RepID=UPI00200F9318|nr:IS200/IS605 family transposase [Conexibacter sp. S30A1]
MGKPGRNNNIVHRCTYHVVWCSKYRRRVLTSLDPAVNNPPQPDDPGPIDARLLEVLREVAADTGSTIIEAEVMPDHVHVLVQVDPQFGVAKLIRLMKGRSSHHLRAEYPSLRRRIQTLWTNSYFVATVGGAPLAQIKQYIENQRHV